MRAVVNDPGEAIERVQDKRCQRRDAQRRWPAYETDPHGERHLHAALGLPWPCPEHERFGSVWSTLISRLTDRGLAHGRGAFGGWDDGDPALVRVAWCLTGHLRAEVVLETGVARGLTTAAILHGLADAGAGHLWSVDLPPLAERELSRETGAAVTPAVRSRWTLLTGSSRSVLPALVSRLERIDVFVHDSMHTTRNVSFELGCVWPHMAPGGVALIDDVERNAGFAIFAAAHPAVAAFLWPSDDHRAIVGCLVKPRDGNATAAPSGPERMNR